MRILRMMAGISMFASSVWLGPLVSETFGTSEIFGFVTVGGLLAFMGGALFYSGVRTRQSF